MQIDFFAREKHHIEHALAIYEKLPEELKGNFITDRPRLGRSRNKVVAVFAYGDLRIASKFGKKVIFGDHGVGMFYNTIHPSYAGSLAFRDSVILRLSPNEIHAKKERETLSCPVEIVGVPKMDKWLGQRNFRKHKKRSPVIAISFHWDCKVCPETKSNYKYYYEVLKEMRQKFKILGHGHPRIMPLLETVYRPLGIKIVKDFGEVIKNADVYICDNSSTLFEFAFVKKPVILLNYPFYRKDIEHEGNPRFWRLANMGIQVDKPDQLIPATYETLANPKLKEQEKAVEEVFYYLDGQCAERAANAIVRFLKTYENID